MPQFTYYIRSAALAFCILINVLAQCNLLFPESLYTSLVKIVTPLTPNIVVLILGWFIIYGYNAYILVKKRTTLSTIDYLLNALWVLLVVYEYYMYAYGVSFLITLRLLRQLPTQLAYLTWMIAINFLLSFVIGGIVFSLLNVIIYIAIANPFFQYLTRYRTMEQLNAQKDYSGALHTIAPVYIAMGMYSLYMIGIIIQHWH